MKPEFWRGRRVLITGHTGFKGAWLSLWLGRLGAHVTGYSLSPPTQPNLFEAAFISSLLANSVTGDIRDCALLTSTLKASGADVVFHLAAQSLVRRGYAEPAETFSTNVMGTANVLDAVRSVNWVRALVIATSDKCYRNRGEGRPFLEDDPLGGEDPYSASKAAAELVTSAWRKAYFSAAGSARIATVRAGNVIGGGDWAQDRIITDLIQAFAGGTAARIRYPLATRPWQHVLDALAGYIELAEALSTRGSAFARAWNFGPDAAGAQTVGVVASQVAALWGDGACWEREPGAHPPEAVSLLLDANLARERLGWRPRLDIRETLKWTVEWYREYKRNPDSARLRSIGQIDTYMRLAA